MKGKSVFRKEEAEQIIVLIQEKIGADSSKQKRIRDKIRKIGFYASDFGIGGGYTVADFGRVVTITGSIADDLAVNVTTKGKEINKRANRDETYVLDICDKILNLKGLRQHRFDFLRGDTGIKLPVDIYYPTLKLVIEYRETQHTEEVSFFDKRMTSSGISRGKQRKKYDELRRTEIPKNNLELIELDYSEFGHTNGKLLLRNKVKDEKIIREKLKMYIPIK